MMVDPNYRKSVRYITGNRIITDLDFSARGRGEFLRKKSDRIRNQEFRIT